MVGIILFSVLMIMMAGLLFAPVILYVDTDENRYEIRHSPVLCLSIHWMDGPQFRVSVFGISLPLSGRKSRKPKSKKVKKQGRKFSRSPEAWRMLLWSVVRSFRVRRVVLDLDTGDVVLNAKLVPVYLLASRGPVSLTGNFQGRAYMHAEVSNTLARLFRIFFQFLTNK